MNFTKKSNELALCKVIAEGVRNKERVMDFGAGTIINYNYNSRNIKTNSADIIGDGINPKISLTSKIFGGEGYKVKSSLFTKKVDGSTVSLEDFIKVNDISNDIAGSQNFAGWFDNFIVPYRRENSIWANRDNLENAIGGQLGNQIPDVATVNISDNPEYVNIKNIPINLGYSKNLIENAKYEALLNYNLADEKMREFEEDLQQNGEFNTLLTLFGASKKETVKGVFNNDAIVEMDANDVGVLFVNGAKSIADIRKTGYSGDYQGFIQKLKEIIAGRLPETFASSSNYFYSYPNNKGMEDPVLVVPVRDYVKLNTAYGIDYVGGDKQYQQVPVVALAREIGVDVVPFGVCDADARSVGYKDYLFDETGDYNYYFLYDRAKLHKFITLPVVQRFLPVNSNYGTTLNYGYFGATTEVFSFDTIVGFKIKLNK